MMIPVYRKMISNNMKGYSEREVELPYVPEIKVVFRPANGDYKATYRHNPALWGCGTTPTIAVGDLVITYGFRYTGKGSA